MARSKIPVGRGRRDAVDQAREMSAVIGALHKKGQKITAASIAARLGLSEAEALKMLDLIMTAGAEDHSSLPLSFANDQGTELVMAFQGGNLGRPLRLNRAEAIALSAALNYLGVAQDDELRQKLESSYSSEKIDIDYVTKTLAQIQSETTRENLSIIAEAIVDRCSLSFRYVHVSGGGGSDRKVTPTNTVHENGFWYMDCFDHYRDAHRRFRVDLMSDTRTVDPIPMPEDTTANDTPATMLTLRFRDPTLINLFDWHGLEIVDDSDQSCVVAKVPYFGSQSDWLPRHIAACGGSVTCDDERITTAARDYARSLLAQ